jgi:hypothetical protein
MTISAIRVPLVQILIEDFATMTVDTSVIVNQAVLIEAESGMTISAIRKRSAAMVFAGVSSMTVAGNLKWLPVSDTAETWDAIADTSENWTPIADNSETWQIAA